MAYSVEKVHCGKNASGLWNTVLTRETPANHVSRKAHLREKVPLK
jgi:hypothetical protein